MRRLHRLQGLRHHHIVKGIIVKIGQPGIQVGLDHIDLFLNAVQHPIRVYLNAIATDLSVCLQPRQLLT
jgi:hypothetical protein